MTYKTVFLAVYTASLHTCVYSLGVIKRPHVSLLPQGLVGLFAHGLLSTFLQLNHLYNCFPGLSLLVRLK